MERDHSKPRKDRVRVRRRAALSAVAAMLCVAFCAHESDVIAKDGSSGNDAVAAAITTVRSASLNAPRNADDAGRVSNAITMLVVKSVRGSFEDVCRIASSKSQPESLRERAVQALPALADASAHKVRTLIRGMIGDRTEPRELRAVAAQASMRREETLDAQLLEYLETVLLRDDDDGLVQRWCLRAVAARAPLDHAKSLLLRDEIWGHDYAGIRQDVCSALGGLRVRSPKAVRVLCLLLMDTDSEDPLLTIPQEAWLSLWLLTGKSYGVNGGKSQLFATPPELPDADSLVRLRMWNISTARDGVTDAMSDCVRDIVFSNWSEFAASARGKGDAKACRDHQTLRRVAQQYLAALDEIEAMWASGGD